MKALTITFRAKPETIWRGEEKLVRVKVPEITSRHCDMHAFRISRRFGNYANSVLFPALLKRALVHVPAYLYHPSTLPDGVQIDATGFLWTVTITLPET